MLASVNAAVVAACVWSADPFFSLQVDVGSDGDDVGRSIVRSACGEGFKVLDAAYIERRKNCFFAGADVAEVESAVAHECKAVSGFRYEITILLCNGDCYSGRELRRNDWNEVAAGSEFSAFRNYGRSGGAAYGLYSRDNFRIGCQSGCTAGGDATEVLDKNTGCLLRYGDLHERGHILEFESSALAVEFCEAYEGVRRNVHSCRNNLLSRESQFESICHGLEEGLLRIYCVE